MEGELAKLDGLEVMHDQEDTLLHLVGVLGTKDDRLSLGLQPVLPEKLMRAPEEMMVPSFLMASL